MDAAPALSAERSRRLGAVSVATGVVAFMPVFGLAIAQGGYFPASWGWASVPLLWCAAIALVLRAELRLGRAECIFLGALVAFAAWIACSISWSAAPAVSVLETQRALVYVAAPFAVLVLAREGATRHILAGALAAVSLIAAFSLATRVLPDRIGVYDGTGVYRLAEPIGYWNGLALFTAIGALVALGFAARDRSTGIRAGSGALLVLLLPTMYFTFGRGAWIALAAGLVAAVAVDPRRLQLVAALVALAPAPALAMVLAARERGLTHEGTPLAVAARDGHRFALVVVGLAAANAGVAAALALAGRVEIGRRPRMLFVAVVLAVAVGAVAVGVVRYGGPVTIAQRAYDSFKAPPPDAQTNLNRRLLNFSGNGRVDLWRVAWAQATRHPVLGAGAGAYERYFLRHQPASVSFVRDAHSLYLETLSELGPIGLLFLLLLLLSPLLPLRHARRHPLVPLAFGGYVAYLVHAAADWDWELPAVTLVGVLCAAAILAAARTTARTPPLHIGQTSRWAMAGASVVVAGLATIGLLGNTALSRSRTALVRGDVSTALTDARRARALMPWSPQPWEALGNADLEQGLLPQARRSFRKAVAIDPGDWGLWSQLAAVTRGSERTAALRRVKILYPQAEIASAKR